MLLQDSLESLAAEQPAPTQESTTGSMTWRGITYQVRNKQVQANLQEVAERQDSSMQTDQAAAGQYDSLIAALNATKASLATVLKAAPGSIALQMMQASMHCSCVFVWIILLHTSLVSYTGSACVVKSCSNCTQRMPQVMYQNPQPVSP